MRANGEKRLIRKMEAGGPGSRSRATFLLLLLPASPNEKYSKPSLLLPLLASSMSLSAWRGKAFTQVPHFFPARRYDREMGKCDDGRSRRLVRRHDSRRRGMLTRERISVIKSGRRCERM